MTNQTNRPMGKDEMMSQGTNRDWLRPDLEGWERDAARFYRQTGYMRPGKDDMGMRTREERLKRWLAWLEEEWKP